MRLFVTGLLILIVYIIAHCSSLNRTTFFSVYVCRPVLDLTEMTRLRLRMHVPTKPRDLYHPRDGGATEKIRSVS
jgi:hypothetical protein